MDGSPTRKGFKEHVRQYSSSSDYSYLDSEFSYAGASTLASRATDYDVYGTEPHRGEAGHGGDDDSAKGSSASSTVASLRLQKAVKWVNTHLSSLPQRSRHPSADFTSRSPSQEHPPQVTTGPDGPQTPHALELSGREWPTEPLTPTTPQDNGYGVRITSLSSPPPGLSLNSTYLQFPEPENTKLFERMRKRHNCIRELYNTEYLFAQDMAVVVRLYMCASADIGLSVRQIDTLFSNVPQVLDISLSLVAILEANIPTQILQGDGTMNFCDVTADEQVRVGKAMCLALNGQLYEVYEDYIHNSQRQLELYFQLTQHLRQHPQKPSEKPTQIASPPNANQISAWLTHCGTRASKFTTAWSLDSLLIKPVQRLGKYPLFLQTLLECTSPEHEDYSDIERALRRSKHYLDCVNARLGQTGS